LACSTCCYGTIISRTMVGRLALTGLTLIPGAYLNARAEELLPRRLLGDTPRYALVDDEIETVWQRPQGDEPPKGIFFIAHGCQHQGTDLFANGGPDGLSDEVCKKTNLGKCLGLPEEVRLRHAALARGYVVMAVSGGTGSKSCWYPGDEVKVRKAVQHVLGEEGMPSDTEVLATGASSGGGFMSALAQEVGAGGLPNLKCIVPEIMDIEDGMNRGIPTLFVHMPRDIRTARAVFQNLAQLRRRGIRADEIEVKPVPITAEFLSPCFPADLADDVLSALKSSNLLDEGGLLKRDARSQLWHDPVAAVLGGKEDNLVPDEGCLSELMNVAYAQHEFTAQHAEEMLDFCESKGAYAPAGAIEREQVLPSSNSTPVLFLASLGFIIILAAVLIRTSKRGPFAKGRADRHALTGQKEGTK